MQELSLFSPCQMISLVVRARLIGLLKQLQSATGVILRVYGFTAAVDKPADLLQQASEFTHAYKSGLQGESDWNAFWSRP